MVGLPAVNQDEAAEDPERREWELIRCRLISYRRTRPDPAHWVAMYTRLINVKR